MGLLAKFFGFDVTDKDVEDAYKLAGEKIADEAKKATPCVPPKPFPSIKSFSFATGGIVGRPVDQILLSTGGIAPRSAKKTVENMRKRKPEPKPVVVTELPTNFKPDLVKQVISGKGKLFKPLNNMFDWSASPQGQAHWQSVTSGYVSRDGWADNVGYKVPKQDIEYLEACMDLYYELQKKESKVEQDNKVKQPSEERSWAIAKLPTDYNEAAVLRLLNTNSRLTVSDLKNMFHWDSCDFRGPEYWQALLNEVEAGTRTRLYKDDLSYLRALQNFHMKEQVNLLKKDAKELTEKSEEELKKDAAPALTEVTSLPRDFDDVPVKMLLNLQPHVTGMWAGFHQAEQLQKAFDWDSVTGVCNWERLYMELVASENMIDLQEKHPHVAAWLLGCLAAHGLKDRKDRKERTGEYSPFIGSSHAAVAGGEDNKATIADGAITAEKLRPEPYEPTQVFLKDILEKKDENFLRLLLVKCDYDLDATVKKLLGECMYLDEVEVRTNLPEHIYRLGNSLRAELHGWFNGNGRLLQTGPEIVDCFLSCTSMGTLADNAGLWTIEQKNPETGERTTYDNLGESHALHVILASDMLTLLEEQKVLCLMNLMLRKFPN